MPPGVSNALNITSKYWFNVIIQACGVFRRRSHLILLPNPVIYPSFSQKLPSSIQTLAPYSIRNLSESSLTQYELDSKSLCISSIILHLLVCHLCLFSRTPTQLYPLRGGCWSSPSCPIIISVCFLSFNLMTYFPFVPTTTPSFQHFAVQHPPPLLPFGGNLRCCLATGFTKTVSLSRVTSFFIILC